MQPYQKAVACLSPCQCHRFGGVKSKSLIAFFSLLLAVSVQAKLKVFILAGQSNMEGAGQIQINPRSKNGGKGTLEYLVKDAKTAKKYAPAVNRDGSWRVRDDVWIWYLGRKGGLSVGYGAKPRMIGPEFQMGHVLGEAFKEQVLLIKTAWGGKTLVKDFRPPSSGGEVGPYYTEMLSHVRAVLADIGKLFPAYDGKGYELSGFFWHQGWNDGLKKPWVEVYEENLANLVKDLRKEWKVPDLPVSIAVTSGLAWYWMVPDSAKTGVTSRSSGRVSEVHW